jgi:zona occludens toxin (predicted ATPase)
MKINVDINIVAKHIKTVENTMREGYKELYRTTLLPTLGIQACNMLASL